MFSEYASKFLSQSQSALQPEQLPRRNRNPYSSQAMPRYFSSTAPAPLFYSATNDFREEDDQAEHHREMADHYALRRSRAQFGQGGLDDSQATDGEEADDDDGDGTKPADGGGPFATTGRGIRSSWRHGSDDGAVNAGGGRRGRRGDGQHGSHGRSPPFLRSGRSSDDHDEDDDDAVAEEDRSFRTPERGTKSFQSSWTRAPLQAQGDAPSTAQETAPDSLLPQGPDALLAAAAADAAVQPRHNLFWAEMFLLAKCALIGVIFLAWLQDSPPDKKHPLGDSIYTVLHASFHLIGVYSLVSVLVGLLWLSLLRSFARPLVMVLLVAVPVISFSFFLYPLISSFNGSWHGKSAQDKLMRWLSLGPAIFCLGWLYTVVKGRRALDKATRMLEFSGEILQANFHLLAIGVATLAAVVLWSWIWVFMFTGLFLGGHATKSGWVIDMSTWWLGAAFFFDYFWTLSVFAGLQRVTTAATVSHWYFHRNTNPTPPRAVLQASLFHAFYTMAGTVCFSTFLALLVRLPLMIFPRRITRVIAGCIYHVLPTSIAVLTNPLTLTFASIHGVPLAQASRGISEMTFISTSSPSTTLGPRSFAPNQPSLSIVSYRLSKTLLHAIRWVITFALGFGGWITTARLLKLNNETVPYTGSLYAYVVGLISATIGWGALGAMEGVLGGILDAVLICWGSEAGMDGSGEARFCIEAGRLFGNEVSRQGRGRYEV
ncbi:hypothetical protein BU23DRAFT_556992 [Bimuria novae-zelandiae CBS 107.79]|uniref:Protein PNS1 n=1 Tax=Bimuria novae-zelandiae CBS 107.79 TaxID=1447943 RepID=A0A6A5V234_9PLEO|nr:hypothetical protein BU23DRAFT_556992 [Bimuria novae-zelandiae CBS 107.79]